jgi:predicted nucleic acid-binding protein
VTAAVAVDTSVAIALLVESHPDHRVVKDHLRSRKIRLTAHSLAETYSVLTRLPGDARREPRDAAAILDATFGTAALLSAEASRTIHTQLGAAGIAGGAVYDAMVALAAFENELTLVTRDLRAAGTYAAMGARVEFIRT